MNHNLWIIAKTFFKDKILTSEFYDEILYRKTYSTKECIQDIAISKENVCKR